MATTAKKEDKGTQGVNASQTKKNGKQEPATATAVVKQEAPAPAEHKVEGKPTTIEQQMKFFDGLAQLVNIKRRFEAHKEALKRLSFSDDEVNKFDTERDFGIRITLQDDNEDEYVINNARLAKDVQAYLVNLLNAKIKEYDQKIMSYGS